VGVDGTACEFESAARVRKLGFGSEAGWFVFAAGVVAIAIWGSCVSAAGMAIVIAGSGVVSARSVTGAAIDVANVAGTGVGSTSAVTVAVAGVVSMIAEGGGVAAAGSVLAVAAERSRGAGEFCATILEGFSLGSEGFSLGSEGFSLGSEGFSLGSIASAATAEGAIRLGVTVDVAVALRSLDGDGEVTSRAATGVFESPRGNIGDCAAT